MEPKTNKNERILNLEWDMARLRSRCNELLGENIRLSTIVLNSIDTSTPYWDDYDETWRCGDVTCDAQLERGWIVCPWCCRELDWEEAEHGRD